MKLKMLFAGLVISVLVSCNTNSNQEKKKDVESKKVEVAKQAIQNFTISTNAAGDFKIGSEIVLPTANDAFELEKNIVTKMVEGNEEEETVYTVIENNEKLLDLKTVASIETDKTVEKINEVIVLSPKFKTTEGIGVSSTIEEFIAAYPAYKLWYTYVGDLYVLETKSVNGLFILSKNDFTKGELEITSDQMNLKKSDFKSTAKIIEVKIY
ncbi:hypothetical protein ACFQ5N_08110 [Lutibacter holmesii]|uniref:Lipocalin-like domain-containing protein n=1 Tax=Lutibacter holmesii TaxID=1137985 RepID=A0ABW3WN01_9FLAO